MALSIFKVNLKIPLNSGLPEARNVRPRKMIFVVVTLYSQPNNSEAALPKMAKSWKMTCRERPNPGLQQAGNGQALEHKLP